MTPPTIGRFVMPARGPEPVSDAERNSWSTMVQQSLPTVRASAQAWRNGLAGLITLVTTGVVVKGRDTTDALSTGWRLAITATLFLGLAAAAVGLWRALAAEAGTHVQLTTLNEIHEKYASVVAYQVDLAEAAMGRLRWARAAVAVSIASLLAGIVLIWWAPAAAPTSPRYLKVREGSTTTCEEVRR